jgi:uncharacterized protein YfkK (UPF0435 family)
VASNQKNITWDDLENGNLKLIFGDWVRGVIRKCFLTFLPVLVTIGGAFLTIATWYLEDIRENLNLLNNATIEIKKAQHEQNNDIMIIKEKLKFFNEKLEKLEAAK